MSGLNKAKALLSRRRKTWLSVVGCASEALHRGAGHSIPLGVGDAIGTRGIRLRRRPHNATVACSPTPSPPVRGLIDIPSIAVAFSTGAHTSSLMKSKMPS